MRISYVRPKRIILLASTNISLITHNKNFWKSAKSLFLHKISRNETIKLVENDTILSDDQVVADTFNNYFKNNVQNLFTINDKNLPKKKINRFDLNLFGPIEAAVSKYN